MNKLMLRMTAIAITAFMAAGLCACAGNNANTTATTGAQTPATSADTGTIDTEDPTMDIDGYGIIGDDGEGESAVDNTSGISEFYYSYNGSIGANSYSYEIREEDDGKVILEYESMEGLMGRTSQEVDSKVLEDLYQLYLNQRIACWNGYNKYAEGVLDGDGFYLSMEFKDGDYMFASGSNCEPDGYYDFVKAMKSIIEPIVDEMEEKYRQDLIADGLQGELGAFMVTFSQNGKSGADDYNFFILHEADREKNFDVQITSESGEFFEEGTYNYFCALPDEAIDFESIKKLIEKYDLIQWIGYDETAEDYMNSEWFQISFDFDNLTIDAMGTEHPDHYDEFRSEFLKLMADMISNAEKNYGLEEYK